MRAYRYSCHPAIWFVTAIERFHDTNEYEPFLRRFATLATDAVQLFASPNDLAVVEKKKNTSSKIINS